MYLILQEKHPIVNWMWKDEQTGKKEKSKSCALLQGKYGAIPIFDYDKLMSGDGNE